MMAVGRARVELTSPAAIAAEFGDAAADASGRREYLAALEVAVGSLAETARHLSEVQGLRNEPHRLVVPAKAVFNTTLVFSESA
jgi:hypothetical protein